MDQRDVTMKLMVALGMVAGIIGFAFSCYLIIGALIEGNVPWRLIAGAAAIAGLCLGYTTFAFRFMKRNGWFSS